ncbi:hypothetical protein [Kitasatospora sp. NA04385]|uniref:hypothetical protein n=1 Tax=Kitasatospora sp. NA04385 TaxID=2742135 RepID=UPI0020CAE7A1|nr:hypothetical protein [Kitasatospora sp. NA04385]
MASTAPRTGLAAPAGLGSLSEPYSSSYCRTTSLTGSGGQSVLAPLSRAITRRGELPGPPVCSLPSTAQQT